MRIAHIPFDLRLGGERRDRVDDDQVDRAAAHECVDDVQRLFAGIRLRNVEIFEVDAQLFGIHGVQRMLGIHKRRDPARLLGLRDGVQGDRRLARRFRAVDLDDAPARDPADPERDIQRQAAGRNDLDVGIAGGVAQLHDGALAVMLFDLREDLIQRLEFFLILRFLFVFHSASPNPI